MVWLIGAGEDTDLDGQDLEGRIIGYPRFERYLIVMQGAKVLGGEHQRDDVEHQSERLARYYPPEARVLLVTQDGGGNLLISNDYVNAY